eukprot:gene24326-30649_t
MLSAMSALRAFRKPETSVVSSEPSGIEGESIESGIIVHHSDDREPLPLALHHTPLSVSLGVFKNTAIPTASSSSSSGAEGDDSATVKKPFRPLLLVTDPTLQEEAAMDGRVSFSINAHRELCAMNKPGGVALPAAVIVKAAQTAARRAESLHVKLAVALEELEVVVLKEREIRQELLRKHNAYNFEQQRRQLGESGAAMDVEGVAASNYVTVGGIDRNDPILAWSSLHQAAGLWNEPK